MLQENACVNAKAFIKKLNDYVVFDDENAEIHIDEIILVFNEVYRKKLAETEAQE